MKRVTAARSLGALVALVACSSYISPQDGIELIRLPEGFRIEIFADSLPDARSLALTPNGVLFVGTRNNGSVYAVRDSDGDGSAESRFTIATGLTMPNGVAYRQGSLYVAEVNRVWRFDDIENRLDNPPAPVLITDRFPDDTWHGWKYIAFGPDDRLYVPVGAPCNVCEREDPYSSITRMNPDGSDFEIVARGVRNTVGFDWHPDTGELWFTDNGRDMMGDDIPPDELNRLTEVGQHFGFPYIHGGEIPDPEFGEGRSAGEFVAPMQQLGPHVAGLGMEFYTGEGFPEEYRGQILIAEHGSWNRTRKIGYRVTLVRLGADGRPTSYETFADGWLQGQNNWGRPVDLEQMSDGSLLLSDDQAGAVYRIYYEG
jgi:glucose/arabinose dehydrogenase